MKNLITLAGQNEKEKKVIALKAKVCVSSSVRLGAEFPEAHSELIYDRVFIVLCAFELERMSGGKAPETLLHILSRVACLASKRKTNKGVGNISLNYRPPRICQMSLQYIFPHK